MKKELIFFIFLIVTFLIYKFLFKNEITTIKSPIGRKSFVLISPTPTPKIVTLAFAGEMIFARTVATKINEYQDYRYPFYKVAPILKKADLRFATLEAPLYGKNTPCHSGCMVFICDEENTSGLRFADINIVSLAANHIMDSGEEGLRRTIELLEQNGIDYIGAGRNLNEARQPLIKKINGIRFGFLAYNNVPPKDYGATENQPGSAWIEENALIEDIKALRPLVDILIISFHWGIEYTAIPNNEQIYFAHLAIDKGSDLIIGDHPHWIQSIEFYKEKPIFYSLGNFVFDQMWSEETQKGIIVFINYQGKDIKEIEIIPFRIKDYVQPVPMEAEQREKMIEYILSISDKKSQEKLKLLLK